ncbi:hypothetical protein EDD41_1293 [Luteococcus japonicus]|uniref:Uncharacterized protein n=1 Tax=Luteococcus japonicus TaxID=33984 RepID=A0A3N1ZUJ3_9ACTN|nr:hypothetical protein [Luteococcus japonicus]ROR54107.1 hypothetical protein EDD41_1293 [Luteococcus japonicus]
MSNKTTTNLDELIEQERRRATARIAKLKRAAAAERRRIDGKVIDLLRDQNSDLYDRLSQEASEALAAEKAKRSRRAKKAALSVGAVNDGTASQTVDPEHEEAAPWNG